jgi:Mannosyltransferase (PIG-V)
VPWARKGGSELGLDDPAASGLGLPAPTAADPIPATATVGGIVDLRAHNERWTALYDVLAAFFSSRTVVWVAGIAAVLLLGWRPGAIAQYDHAHLTMPFHQTVGNLLVAPATRWDSAWYLGIARAGYVLPLQTVFFPLYPGLIALGGAFVGQGLDAIVGIAISCACAIGALYLLHRLVSLEFDEHLAHDTVWIFAWLPTAIVLSAVYSESLFLFLAVGCFYSARSGRWALAGLAGGLAAATRNGGVLLLVPLLILYLYGPQSAREPDRPAGGLWPRYRLRGDIFWMALVPLGLLAYMAFLQIEIGHPLAPFTHQLHWGRHFIPLAGIPLGLLSLGRATVAAIPGLDPALAAHVTLVGELRRGLEVGFLILALALLRVCWKRLPLAYTAFAAISLAMAVSVPTSDDPLKSLPRFTLVMFPLWIALALWASERRRVRGVIATCAPLLALSAFMFVGWIMPP